MKIYLDESGTPGDQNLKIPFIFGGFYTFKVENDIIRDWEDFIKKNPTIYKQKSTYYTETIWLPFAKFLSNDYYPVIAFSYCTEDDKSLIKQKCKEYNEIKHLRANDTPEKITSPDLIWSMLSSITVFMTIVTHIIRNKTHINQLSIQMDRFNTKKELKQFTEFSIKNFLTPEKLIQYIVEGGNLNSHELNSLNSLFNKCIQFNDCITFHWNIKKVKEFPGAICSLHRRYLEDIDEAKKAKQLLKSKEITIDATELIRNKLKTLNWDDLLMK